GASLGELERGGAPGPPLLAVSRARASALPAPSPRLHAKDHRGAGAGGGRGQAPMRAVRALGRAALELLVRLVYWPGKRQPIDAAALRRVLVIRPDPRVGNVLLTVPLLRALRAGL